MTFLILKAWKMIYWKMIDDWNWNLLKNDWWKMIYWKMINDLFNIISLKKHLILFEHHTFIYSFLSVKHNIPCFCEIQLSSVLVFSIDVLLIACPEEIHFCFKIIEVKNQWAFLKIKTVTSDILTFDSSVWELQILSMRPASQILLT